MWKHQVTKNQCKAPAQIQREKGRGGEGKYQKKKGGKGGEGHFLVRKGG